MRTRRIVALGMTAVLLALSLGSQPALAASPSTPVHAWALSLHQFQDQWEGFIVRMAVSGTPDVISVQDVNHCYPDSLSRATFNDFMAKMRQTFPLNTWNYRHTKGTACGSGSAVIWNDSRFSISNSNMSITDACSYGSPALVALRERSTGNTLAVASIHVYRNATCGISNVLGSINTGLENLSPVRHLSLITGDFNTRPDHDGEQVTNGLEAAPDCWYTGFSALHASGCSVAADRYYDSAWVEPTGGGGVNPAATSICQQFTKIHPVSVLDDKEDAGNSCTDLDGNGLLDRNRIDYIWPSWERDNGNVWRPSLAEAQALIEFASADTGLSLTAPDRYSDHRAVEAIIAWPPVEVP